MNKTPIVNLISGRKNFIELRYSGFGFVFLKPMGKRTFTAVQAFSACKDYLNDVVYAEQTGKQYYAYGLTSTKKNIFNGNRAFMAMASLYGAADRDPQPLGLEDQKILLDKNLGNISAIINSIEKSLELKHRTRLIRINDNLVLIFLPLDWVVSSWALSMYALIMRNAPFCKSVDDPWHQLIKHAGSSTDQSHLQKVSEVFQDFVTHGLPDGKEWRTEYDGDSCDDYIHNRGIIYFLQHNHSEWLHKQTK